MIGIGNNQLMKNNIASIEGQYQAYSLRITGIMVSNDYGVSFTENITDNLDYRQIRISSTGQYMSCVIADLTGKVAVSSNYGVTWDIKSTGRRTGFKLGMSSNGQYQVVSSGSGIIGYMSISSDYGATWGELTSAGSRDWQGISISSTGQYMVATVDLVGVYVSDDYGATWTSTAYSEFMRDCEISSSGEYMVVCRRNATLQISSNYGVSWGSTGFTASKSWQSLGISSNGQFILAGTSNTDEYFYYSDDYLATATTYSSAGNQIWTGMAISTSGKYQLACAYNYKIYKSSDYGVTWADLGAVSALHWGVAINRD